MKICLAKAAIILGIGTTLGILSFTVMNSSTKPIEAGNGRCADCACPGFRGPGWACTRGGCHHHYDRHY